LEQYDSSKQLGVLESIRFLKLRGIQQVGDFVFKITLVLVTII
jgi:hypothetical protein